MGNIIYPLWDNCPALTRIVCAGYPAVSLLAFGLSFTPVGWLTPLVFQCNLQAVQELHIWAIFTSCFCNTSMLSSGFGFIMCLFEVYMAMIDFPLKERQLGSTAFLLFLFLVNAMVNTVHLAIMFAFCMYYHNSFEGLTYMMRANNGLFPMILVLVTLRALSDMQGSTNFWGLMQIPNKVYPLALLGIIFLLSGLQIVWPLVAALIVGYSYVFLRIDKYMPSSLTAGRLEQQFPCCRGNRCQALGAYWVPATSTQGYGFEADGGDRRYANLSDFGRTSGQQLTTQQPRADGSGGRGGQFTVFSGQGNTLGDGTEAAAVQPLAPAGPSQALAAAVARQDREMSPATQAGAAGTPSQV